MDDRRRMLIAAGGRIPPANLFSGGELAAVSAPGSVPAIAVSDMTALGKAVFLFGFTPAGSDSNGSNCCIYKYKNGFLTQIMSAGCAMTAKAVDGKSCFCFSSAAQGQLGLIAALCFSANEHAAERVLSKMSIKYWDCPREWTLSSSPAVAAAQMRLESGLPAPGDPVFLVSQSESGGYFGVSLCGEEGNKEHLCGDNKLIIQDGTWGASGCTDTEMTDYNDFSVYSGNFYGRIYGMSFG